MNRAAFTAAALGCLLWAAGTQYASAQPSTRDLEIAQCLPGEISTWGDGQDRPASRNPLVFVYRHSGAPAWFDEGLVRASIQRAATAWSTCGIAAQLIAGVPANANAVQVQWSEEGSRRNFGLANLGEATLSLGPSAFQLLQTRNPTFDSRQTLQMVISHEMGHFFGLMAHSRRCVDVTSYYTNVQGDSCRIRDGRALPAGVEYRSTLPTACDIARCRAANGTPATRSNTEFPKE